MYSAAMPSHTEPAEATLVQRTDPLATNTTSSLSQSARESARHPGESQDRRYSGEPGLTDKNVPRTRRGCRCLRSMKPVPEFLAP